MAERIAHLYPQVAFSDLPGFREPAYASVERKKAVLGNGLLEVSLQVGGADTDKALFLNKVSGEEFPLEFRPFQGLFDQKEVTGEGNKLTRIEPRGSANVSSITAYVAFPSFDLEVTYVLGRSDHFLQKRLAIRNLKDPVVLHRVSLFNHRVDPKHETILHEGGMYAPVVFTRGAKGSLFFCIDFPCSFVEADAGGFRFDYYPGESLRPGRSFHTLTAVVGMTLLAGRRRRNPYHDRGAELDEGERQAFRQFLRRGAASSELPLLEMKGPEAGTDGPSDLEIVEQAQWLGVKHVILPRLLTAVDAYPSLDLLKQRMAELNITSKFVWIREETERLRWLTAGAQAPGEFDVTKAIAAVQALRMSIIDHYLGVMERHGFTEVEVMGLPLMNYAGLENESPDPLVSREGFQRAFQGMVELVAALRENFANVGSAGAYSCYGVGVAKLFDAVSAMVDEHPLPLPDIHVGRLFADMGRLYFRRSHDFLIPKAVMNNSIGLAQEARRDAPYPGAESYPWYLYHDSQGWRYAIISAIATGLRHRFHPLPMDLPEEDKLFATRWLKWEEEHLQDLEEVEEILDEPGMDAVDGYSYTSGRGAIVFLFNNSYDAQEVTLQLHLTHDSEYLVRELYPREMNYLGPNEGLFRRDGRLRTVLAGREARIVEAVRRSPAAAKRKKPEVFGAEAVTSKEEVKVFGTPGARVEIGVRKQGKYEKKDVRFPGEAVSPYIRDWVYATRAFDDGHEALPQGGFAGQRLSPDAGILRNAWLHARVKLPAGSEGSLNTTEFRLSKPCWTYEDRLFFVVRFEPVGYFDPVRTASEKEGFPECYWPEQPQKAGIDLAPLNIGLKAWINGEESQVYPALAAWKRLSPNPLPVVAYFFEAGTRIRFGGRNAVVLYARHFDSGAFKGIYMEHLPSQQAEFMLTQP